MLMISGTARTEHDRCRLADRIGIIAMLKRLTTNLIGQPFRSQTFYDLLSLRGRISMADRTRNASSLL